MFALGFIGVLTGVYLIDSAIKARPPIKTLVMLVANPDKTESVLAESNGTITPAGHDS